MLYLIGGAARSGKSTLARRLLDARQLPFFCRDYLTGGLEAGVPSLGVRHEIPDQRRGELVWPVLRGLLRNIVEVEPRYVVEGKSAWSCASWERGYPARLRAGCGSGRGWRASRLGSK